MLDDLSGAVAILVHLGYHLDLLEHPTRSFMHNNVVGAFSG